MCPITGTVESGSALRLGGEKTLAKVNKLETAAGTERTARCADGVKLGRSRQVFGAGDRVWSGVDHMSVCPFAPPQHRFLLSTDWAVVPVLCKEIRTNNTDDFANFPDVELMSWCPGRKGSRTSKVT